MNEAWKKLVENSADAKSFVTQVSASGIDFLKSNMERVPLFASTHAIINERSERDESHYFLVPSIAEGVGYSVYTIRSLPPGVGAVNSLEKARIFHVHDVAGVDLLESQLIADHRSEIEASDEGGSADLADRLDELSRKIDVAANSATGGLIIIGTLVAISNPLLGAGLLVKALIPSIGQSVATSGIKYVGDKIRQTTASRKSTKVQKLAEKEAKRLKPELVINPILKDLQFLVVEKDAELPAIHFDEWLSDLGAVETVRLSIRAVLSVYEEPLALPSRKNPLTEGQMQWLREIAELLEASE